MDAGWAASCCVLLLLGDAAPLLGDVDPDGWLFGAAGAAPSCVGGSVARGRLRLSLSELGKSVCCHCLPFQNCKLLVLLELTACSQLSHAAACKVSQVLWGRGKATYLPCDQLQSKCTHHSAVCTSTAVILLTSYDTCHSNLVW